MSDKSLEYKIGELSGQVSSLVASMKNFMDALTRLESKVETAISSMEQRIDTGAVDMQEVKTKLAMWGGSFGFIAGLIGSIIVSLILHRVGA